MTRRVMQEFTDERLSWPQFACGHEHIRALRDAGEAQEAHDATHSLITKIEYELHTPVIPEDPPFHDGHMAMLQWLVDLVTEAAERAPSPKTREELLQRCEAILLDALARAEQASDYPEAPGSVRWSLFRLYLAWSRYDPERLTQAAANAQGVVEWAKAWRGEVVVGAALLDLAHLARALGQHAEALAHLDAAYQEFAKAPHLFKQLAGLRLRSEVLAATGQLDQAKEALDQGLELARAQLLRLEELELLHRRAELPPADGAADHRLADAQAALDISEALAFPRDEARAALALARARIAAGEPPDPSSLKDAEEIFAELGPPSRLDEVRALREQLSAR